MKWLNLLKPIQLLIYGYFGILIIGFLLLCLPIFHKDTIAVIDHLFMATSAISTTGLASVDITGSYNIAGQIILLLLVQLGGLGYMSIGSFVMLLNRRTLSDISTELIQCDFSLPDQFSILDFIRDLMLFTFVIELVGAIALSSIFWANGESNYIWQGIFHSVSAFCTAGFSLFSNSFEGYQSNFYLNAVISILSIGGALGFIVFTDVFEMLKGRKSKITFTSRIILRFTFWGMVAGTSVLFISDANIAQYPPEEGLMIAFFQSMAAFTTVGFSTYPITAIAMAPLFFIVILMIVGASPSGTGGGMKSTTFTALYAQLRSTFRGKQEVIFMHRKIPAHRIQMAISNFFFYMLVICIGTYLLLLVEKKEAFDVLFEAVSALGTVGLSAGITSDLSTLGKLFIIALMFLGRIGPLSFGIALFSPNAEELGAIIEEDLAI